MKVLIVGATGYLGGSAARVLRAAGHEILGTVRSEEAHARLKEEGYAAIGAGVDKPRELARAAAGADAAIYAVQLNQSDAQRVETAALEALVEAFNDGGKPLIYTSGVWYYGRTGDRVADETTPPNPPPTAAARPQLEKIVLDGAQRGVRAIVVRPGDVFGEGKGLPSMFVASARETGAAKTFGDGRNRWPVVHIDDVGQLYLLALEKAAPGDVYNATDDTTFTQLEIAQAASRGAGKGGATSVFPLDEAASEMGEWVRNLALDQIVTSVRARSRLGWTPNGPTILEDLEFGSYALTVTP